MIFALSMIVNHLQGACRETTGLALVPLIEIAAYKKRKEV
jgi:hypothetical protein